MATVFKNISSKNVSKTVVEEEPAWLFPNERGEPSKLSSISLSRKDTELKQEPGKQVPRYFYKVYDRTDGIEKTEEAQYPQFTVTYGNRNGGGSPSFFDDDGNKTGSTEPTKAIYSQYASALLGGRKQSFGFRKDHFYAINFNSRTLKNGLVAESLELTLSFGKNDDITLVLDEESEEGEFPIYRKFPVFREGEVNAPNVFGAFGVPSPQINQTGGRIYGYIYPKQGTIILDPDGIAEDISSIGEIIPETRGPDTILNTENSSNVFIQPGDSLVNRTIKRGENGGFVYDGGFNEDLENAEDIFPDWPYVRNHDKIFEAIKRGKSFVLDVERTTVENVYEIEIEGGEFNASSNPTFSDESGNVEFEGDNPYFTTVGLYNEDKKLLALGKLESPMQAVESDLTITIGY
jgi:hypothetical protein